VPPKTHVLTSRHKGSESSATSSPASADAKPKREKHKTYFKWSEEATNCLLKLRLELAEEFKGCHRQSDGWAKVVARMKDVLPPLLTLELTADGAQSKFKSLRAAVIKFQKERKDSGNETLETPCHYEIIRDILGEKSATFAGPPYTSSSLGPKRKRWIADEEDEENEEDNPPTPSTARPPSPSQPPSLQPSTPATPEIQTLEDTLDEEDEVDVGSAQRKEAIVLKDISNVTVTNKHKIKKTPKMAKTSRGPVAQELADAFSPLFREMMEHQSKMFENVSKLIAAQNTQMGSRITGGGPMGGGPMDSGPMDDGW
jgi:hypothetical protein